MDLCFFIMTFLLIIISAGAAESSRTRIRKQANKGFSLNLVVILSTTLFFPGPLAADIYRYVDEKGILHFCDFPRHEGYSVYLKEDHGPKRFDRNVYYPYRSLILEASKTYGIDETLLRAVMEIESDGDKFAISRAGARGLMQLMPETARLLGVSNPWNPRQNVMGGAKYLQGLTKKFEGNLSFALAAYNAGVNNVIKYGKVPPFAETERYVRKVMDLYRRYSQLVE